MKVRKVKFAIRSTDDVLKEAAETMKSVARGKGSNQKAVGFFLRVLKHCGAF